jgi:hypothetical protein
MFQPQQVAFGPDYPDLAGLTFNGWEVDREILSELDEGAWVEAAEEVQSALTDELIDDAVARLPAAHGEIVGEFLSRSLKARRDGLVEQTRLYFAFLAREVDVKATDRSEHAAVEYLPDGDMRLTLRFLDGTGTDAPHFERVFRAGVTSEVRVYLRGGDDLVTVDGGPGGIRVRAIGGGGDDHFIDGSATVARRTNFYDDRGENRVGGRARIDTRSYERPAASNQAHRDALDWGSRNRLLPHLSFDRELGILAGASFDHERYGFRAAPARTEHSLRAALVSAGPAFLVGWDGRYRELVHGADLVFEARYSGLEVLRFYGFGAGTAEGPDDELYRVEQRELTLAPGLEWSWGTAARKDDGAAANGPSPRPALRLGLGPILKVSDTPERANRGRFITSLDPAPLGFGRFAQAGGRAWLEVDTRDNPAYPTRGIRLQAVGEAYGGVLDADRPFARAEGRLTGYLTPGEGSRRPTLAARVGAARATGAFPFHEAAFLGGRRDLLGSREQRFAGEAAVFANAEARLPVLAFDLLFPTELGLHAATEVGRVFHEQDAAIGTPWQRGFGGGIWLSFLDRAQTLSITLVQGRERLGVHLGGGFHF